MPDIKLMTPPRSTRGKPYPGGQPQAPPSKWGFFDGVDRGLTAVMVRVGEKLILLAVWHGVCYACVCVRWIIAYVHGPRGNPIFFRLRLNGLWSMV